MTDQETALIMLRRLGKLDKLPKNVVKRLDSLHKMLQRDLDDTEIALTISMCAGETVIYKNMPDPYPVMDGGD